MVEPGGSRPRSFGSNGCAAFLLSWRDKHGDDADLNRRSNVVLRLENAA